MKERVFSDSKVEDENTTPKGEVKKYCWYSIGQIMPMKYYYLAKLFFCPLTI